MKYSRFTESQIISIPKEADAGAKVKEICRPQAWPQPSVVPQKLWRLAGGWTLILWEIGNDRTWLSS
jgi:hypothetical protein